MSQTHPHLGMTEFGEHLLRTGDLDPVYLALNRSDFDEAQRLRWLVAYCGFYHRGVSCYLSARAGDEFGEAFEGAARETEPTPIGGR